MIVAILTIAILLSSVITIAEIQAKPFYSKSDIKKLGGKPDGKIKGLIQADPQCKLPPEWYTRATPKNNNNVILNKEDIKNTGKGLYSFSWYYDVNKIKATKDTNEGKIRTYAVGVDIQDKQTGIVVTHYKEIKGKKPVDFGVFDMRGASACS